MHSHHPAETRLSSRSPGRPKNDLAPTGGGSAPRAEPGAQLTVLRQALAILALTLAGCIHVGPATADTPILVYHRFGPQATDSMMVRTEAFEAQLRQLADNGFQVIPLQRLVDYIVGHLVDRPAGRNAPPLPPRAVVLTVDDGHRTVYTELFPLIKRHRLPVTLFIYPSAISNAPYALTWAQLAELRASGLVDIQSHTYWHPNFFRERRKMTAEDYAVFTDGQLAKSKRVLEARLGGQVDLLAWPFGLEDADLRARAARAGYRAAFTIERRAARPGDDALALPRYLMTDAVRDKDFAAILRQADRVSTPGSLTPSGGGVKEQRFHRPTQSGSAG